MFTAFFCQAENAIIAPSFHTHKQPYSDAQIMDRPLPGFDARALLLAPHCRRADQTPSRFPVSATIPQRQDLHCCLNTMLPFYTFDYYPCCIMKFTTEVAIAVLAFTNLAVADAPSRRWTGSLSARANTLGRRQIEIGGLKLGGGGNATAGEAGGQTKGGNGGGLTIGGLTLGGSKGGISGNGLSLPGGQNNNQGQQGQAGGAGAPETQKPAEGAARAEGQPAQESKPAAEAAKPSTTASAAEAVPTETASGAEKPAKSAPAAEAAPPKATVTVEASKNGTATEAAPVKESQAAAAEPKAPATKPAAPATEPKAEPQTGAGPGTENQPGRAEGEAAAAEAKGEAAALKGETAAEANKSNGVKATEESERFSEEAGITLNKDGSAANLGGNLGITQGSDGSKSVGGENGINIAANGQATAAGTERE
ncbi:hypothetical protein PSPO01_12756 [Paraphaeosphaeria sporulosa]